MCGTRLTVLLLCSATAKRASSMASRSFSRPTGASRTSPTITGRSLCTSAIDRCCGTVTVSGAVQGGGKRRGEARRDETRRMMPATTAGCSSGSAGAGMFYSEREQTKAMACGRCLRWSPFAGRCEYGDGDGGEGCCGTSAASLTARSDALRGSKAVRRRKAVEPSVLLWLHGWVPPPVPCFEVLFFYLQLMYRTE